MRQEAEFMMSHCSKYLLNAFTWNDTPCLIATQWMSRGDLFSILQKKLLDWGILFQIFNHIALGIRDLHALGWVHFDLKLENILVDSEYQAVVADFGLSRKIRYGMTNKNRRGSPYYVSIELFDQTLYMDLREADIYSMGVVLAIAVTRKQIPDIKTVHQLRMAKSGNPSRFRTDTENILNNNGPYPEGIRELILRCIDDDHKKRPTIYEFLDSLAIIQARYYEKYQNTLETQFFEQLARNKATGTLSLDCGALFSAMTDDEKDRVITQVMKEKADGPLLATLADSLYPFASNQKMADELNALSRTTPHRSFANQIQNISEYRGALFSRRIRTRAIAETGIPSQSMTIVEEYVSGRELKFY